MNTILISQSKGYWGDCEEIPTLLLQSEKTLEELQNDYIIHLKQLLGEKIKTIGFGKIFNIIIEYNDHTTKELREINKQIKNNSFVNWLLNVEKVIEIKFNHCII